jgi:hypothetical protein
MKLKKKKPQAMKKKERKLKKGTFSYHEKIHSTNPKCVGLKLN